MIDAASLILRRQMRVTRYGRGVQAQYYTDIEKADAKYLPKIQRVLNSMTDRDKKAYQQNKHTVRADSLRKFVAEWSKAYNVALKSNLMEGYDGVYAVEKAALSVAPKKATIDKPPRLILGQTAPTLASTSAYKFNRYIDSTLKQSFSDQTDPYLALSGTQQLNHKDGAVWTRDRSAMTWLMTSVLAGAATGRLTALKEQEVKRFVWLSTLDGRTCMVCATRDQESYPEEKMPDQPAHENCRCVYIADLDYGEDSRRGALEDTTLKPKGHPDRVDPTTVPGSKSFPEWFKSTDTDFQKEWLGPSRYKLYKEGKLKLDKFVDPRGRVYTLDDLAIREKEAYEVLKDE